MATLPVLGGKVFLTDSGGAKHLVKAGCDIFMSTGVTHRLTEILGFAAGFALGFEGKDATHPGQRIKVSEMGTALLGQAVAKPVGSGKGTGLSVIIRKRKNWDDIAWRFTRQDGS
ncbi:hypothetical protein F66182_3057 [Fusarium sp. NRRL 66182]|nr:hypothetical protein F66182_3057 [Fusarium sp. NRRL 66182]